MLYEVITHPAPLMLALALAMGVRSDALRAEDEALTLKLIELEMMSPKIYAIVVREADGKKVFCARERDSNWQPVAS